MTRRSLAKIQLIWHCYCTGQDRHHRPPHATYLHACALSPPGLQHRPSYRLQIRGAHITCPSQTLPTFAWLGLIVPCRALEANLPFALLYKEHVQNLIVAPPPPPVLSGERAQPAQKLKIMTRPTKCPPARPHKKRGALAHPPWSRPRPANHKRPSAISGRAMGPRPHAGRSRHNPPAFLPATARRRRRGSARGGGSPGRG